MDAINENPFYIAMDDESISIHVSGEDAYQVCDQIAAVFENKTAVSLENSTCYITEKNPQLDDHQMLLPMIILRRQVDFPFNQGPDIYVSTKILVHGNLNRDDLAFFRNLQIPAIIVLHLMNHWVTVSNISLAGKFDKFKWRIYDSLNHDYYFDMAKRILYEINPNTELEKVEVQTQNGFDDCGLFAIANAINLCLHINPASVKYDQSKMRAHYNLAIERKHFDPFPTLRN
jgi:hypothetical protein